MYIIIGHHYINDQGITVGMMHATSITIAEGDVVILPLEVLCRPFVQVINISERPLLRFLGIAVLRPMCLSSEMWFSKDGPGFSWGLCLWLIILQSRPPVIDVVLQVPVADEFFYLIFQGDALFCCMADIFVKPAILILISLRAISLQRVRLFENS